MSFKSLLIANRGEIAIRIARAASDLGIPSVAVYSQDDEANLHTRVADSAFELEGKGARAYLDIEAIVMAAKANGCDAVHPGYGFLSEQGEFARRCQQEGITFIGPRVEHLELFGDKARARSAAVSADVPVLRGIDRAVSLEEARGFFADCGGSMIIKAIAGGGGRGTSAVIEESELESIFERCQREAKAAFGIADVYVEEFVQHARHVEVQIVGDLHGGIAHLWERECSIQRRNQKVIEIAPAPGLDESLRDKIIDAAVRFAEKVGYSSLGTFEFLVDCAQKSDESFVFIEANARLQVEHTVTEEVTDVDIVQSQIRLAAGEKLSSLGLDKPIAPRGYAIQTRINMETFREDGAVRPSSGVLTAYDAPNGPGVRTDGFGYVGYKTSTAFDSLLAKVITHSKGDDFEVAVNRTIRALSEFRIEGVGNNISFVQNILAHSDFVKSEVHTRWVEKHISELVGSSSNYPRRYVEGKSEVDSQSSNTSKGYAGARVDMSDPLALFDHDAKVKANETADSEEDSDGQAAGPDGTVGMSSPIQGTIVSIAVEVGEEVREGQVLALVEAMKMEHVIAANIDGLVREVSMKAGDIVRDGFAFIFIEEAEVKKTDTIVAEEIDLDYIRPDLQESIARHAYILDENRKEAVEKRRARGYRMPRENISELMDEGSFKEYWPLIVAARHSRHDIETLRKQTPGDGLIAGTGTINADLFSEETARAMIVHYDYTVLAGTQGKRNHYKQDRMFELAQRFRMPLVLFGEGGGGRPGDDSRGPAVAFDTNTFTTFSKLSGLVPLVCVINGRTFAGNTALVACCDVIIATENTTVAMGGPAMIEGGGLGIYTPEEVGPMSFQVPNGVVDILVKDEKEAVQVAKKYLSYFQGATSEWEANDQRPLRHVIPENRLRLYDMREVIKTIADIDSVLEIREKFGIGVITSFIRVEGRPMGVIANNPHHLAGAIDSDGADKGARFIQLCDAFDIPILSLMDCPGMMVGPDVEKTALVRHCTRMFNAGANLTVPLFGVVVRKAYGLGVQAMCGASALVGFFTVAWPTAEFSGMNIEGAVKLGYRNELAAIEDPQERKKEFEDRVARSYDSAKAVNAAPGGGLDDVIDPAETRGWIAASMKRVPPTAPRTEKKYPFIDTW
ncbi:MAG: carbamoyl-phosphate synthase large subunit [Gammaproteobacteria bacterium]|nr:carbamoyl-phosphate synthase large subunit [Gammaproteobacteria bacterium]OUV68140.1 MAG: carbamoyl-phosphate synthase large subunit [Gammaproteobacteria bacterium TMED133]